MIRQMVLNLLGPLGRQALEFYVANSVVINGVIVAYALLLLIARRNLARIEDHAVQDLRSRLPRLPKASLAKTPTGFSWRDIIRKASFFPFVAGRASWFPRFSRPETVARLCPLPRLLERIEGNSTPASEGGPAPG